MAKSQAAAKTEDTPAPIEENPNSISATAKIKDEDGNVSAEIEESIVYDLGSNLDDAVSKFGADVVFTNFKQSAVIAAQGRMRSLIQKGARGDALQSKMNEWKPGIKTVTRKSPAEKVKDLLAGKSKDEIAAILAQAGLG